MLAAIGDGHLFPAGGLRHLASQVRICDGFLKGLEWRFGYQATATAALSEAATQVLCKPGKWRGWIFRVLQLVRKACHAS